MIEPSRRQRWGRQALAVHRFVVTVLSILSTALTMSLVVYLETA